MKNKTSKVYYLQLQTIRTATFCSSSIQETSPTGSLPQEADVVIIGGGRWAHLLPLLAAFQLSKNKVK